MENIINGLKQIKTRVDSGTITTVNGTETLLSKQLEYLLKEAINYTRCSTQLKDKEPPTLEEYGFDLRTRYIFDNYWIGYKNASDEEVKKCYKIEILDNL